MISVAGRMDLDIGRITFDSREVQKGDLFVAVPGTQVDGHTFIPKAIAAGAVAVVAEDIRTEMGPTVTLVRVPDTKKALALMAAAFYGFPSAELNLVGITGTNGKTTIATLLHEMHGLMGYKAGLLSTIQVLVGEKTRPASHTTPDPIQINRYLREMVDAGCAYCFMEVSSHAIDQDRIGGLEFGGGVFTNLSRDHLDYHRDFKDYLDVKKRFFDHLPEAAFALVNGDDKHGKVMLQNSRAEPHVYGLQTMCEFRGKLKEMHLEGSALDIQGREVWVKLPGKFNAGNLLCVYAVGLLLGHPQEEVIQALSQVNPVKGRFETFRSKQGITGIVDYAHTPDALQNVLDTIREVNVGGGEIITVVGAGGNRDRGKRPAMARIGAEGSHKLILTSDNPRNEDPEAILDDMMEGIPASLKERTLRIVSRKEAIRTACIIAKDQDIILVAGKGHELSQEIGGEKKAFDDMHFLKQFLNG
jgi:UDP-N-acetylmuramoyl-L-alanyl-D-glutamate--2,6-diaminopimelate ligase